MSSSPSSPRLDASEGAARPDLLPSEPANYPRFEVVRVGLCADATPEERDRAIAALWELRDGWVPAEDAYWAARQMLDASPDLFTPHAWADACLALVRTMEARAVVADALPRIEGFGNLTREQIATECRRWAEKYEALEAKVIRLEDALLATSPDSVLRTEEAPSAHVDTDEDRYYRPIFDGLCGEGYWDACRPIRERNRALSRSREASPPTAPDRDRILAMSEAEMRAEMGDAAFDAAAQHSKAVVDRAIAASKATPCADCGTPLDPGTAKVFTVCDGCWDKHYAKLSALQRDASGETPWVIWSDDHQAWWRPNGAGYAPSLLGAGVYTEREAKATEADCEPHKARARPLSDAIGGALKGSVAQFLVRVLATRPARSEGAET